VGKKKFVDGLESLFGPTVEENFEGEGFMGRHVKPDKEKRKKNRKRPSGKKLNKPRSSSGKNFTSDLDSLFEHVVTETVEAKLEKAIEGEIKTTPKIAKTRRRLRKPMSGLDALIRRTVEETKLERMEIPAPTKKRVTFVFDKEKLSELKRIAKLEKTYLKDILGDLITEYIDKYQYKDVINGKSK